jgi:hypothetical protein
MAESSWADVLRKGLSKGFRNPIKQAKRAAYLAKIEEDAKREAEVEKERKIKIEYMLHLRGRRQSYYREKERKERLEELERERNYHRKRMQEIEDHEDYWGIGHENRLDLIVETEYSDKWDIMEEELTDLNFRIAEANEYYVGGWEQLQKDEWKMVGQRDDRMQEDIQRMREMYFD